MRSIFPWVLLLAATVVAVYWPGLSGPFVYDDFANLVGNARLRGTRFSLAAMYQAAVSGNSSELGRPLSMLSFAFNYALTGSTPFHFKLVNLALHACNAILVCRLVFLLASRSPAFREARLPAPTMAFLAAALWALHPIHVSTVLYTVQRMTELSSFFMLVGLLLYVDGRLRMTAADGAGAWRVAAALIVMLPLAVLSKENGVLLLAYAWVIEVFALRGSLDPMEIRRSTRFQVALLLTCAGGGAFLLAPHLSTFAEHFAGKSFSAHDRMLTEPRVLLWYLQMLLLPDLTAMGLVHDDWQISRSLATPWVTLPAILILAGLVAAVPAIRHRAPAAAFGIGWFLAGHALEAAPLPLELVFEHRNYLPSLGIAIAALDLGARLLHRFAPPGVQAGRWLLGAALAALAALTLLRVDEWSDLAKWSVAQHQHHPDSAAANYFLAALYSTLALEEKGEPEHSALVDEADKLFVRAAELSPSDTNALVGRIILLERSGRKPPAGIYEDVARRVSRGMLSASSINGIFDFVDCSARRLCTTPEPDLLRVVDAVMSNPDAWSFVRSRLLALLADYYGENRGDARRAMTVAKAATEIEGATIVAWFTLAKWLAINGYPSEAIATLGEVEKRDRLGEHRLQRLEMLQQIQQMIR